LGNIDRLQGVVLADPALQARLGRIEDRAAFIESTLGVAQACSIPLGRRELEEALGANPAGARPPQRPVTTPAPAGWLPARVFQQDDRLWLDWAYFGVERLGEPFFEQSLQRVQRRPFNRLFRLAAPLEAWSAAPDGAAPSLKPSGLIFHMSRCGSTLAAQMLAACDGALVVSEAAPIDAIVRLDLSHPATGPARSDLLHRMALALGQIRSGDERRYLLKLDSWHMLALPLFRQAFPGVPWVFLYREPHEVMVSQMRRRGIQMIPELVPPSLFGLDPPGAATEDYWAQVLATVCDAALRHHPEGQGLLVNYDELPQAVWTRIAPHFGLACSEGDRRRMAEAARLDAKSPATAFSADGAAKRGAVTQPIRLACQRHLDDLYRRLEALRLAEMATGPRGATRNAPP